MITARMWCQPSVVKVLFCFRQRCDFLPRAWLTHSFVVQSATKERGSWHVVMYWSRDKYKNSRNNAINGRVSTKQLSASNNTKIQKYIFLYFCVIQCWRRADSRNTSIDCLVPIVFTVWFVRRRRYVIQKPSAHLCPHCVANFHHDVTLLWF